MSYSMSAEETREFLSSGTQTGKLATTRADGRPHVAPIWFVLDGDDLVFNTNEATLKGKSLLRDPRASLVVDLAEPPFAFVLVEGTVTISRDVEEMLPWSIAIARRYMGDAKAEAYGRRNAVEGELLVRLHPTHTVALGGISD